MSAGEAPAGENAAMLIDADNLSATAIEHAFAHLARQGLRATLRRAYGGHEKLAGMKDCLLRHGVRSLVNHGKGTTDALLVVDAMDLLHEGRMPPVVAIASSDGDFAPLALRLREAGHWVICFAQSGKSADVDLTRCYDQLVSVEGAPAASEAPPAPARAARKTPARKKAKPAEPPPPPMPADPVRELLEGLDGFRQGREIAMNEVVKRLRDAKLLGKSASGPAFLRKRAPYLELSSNHLRLKQ
ncbi:MAG TPA: NYN domain-containing protein [Ramlibacter sp.]|uniref:NYN domain-containing protein n=1 Tax=Ramlibacter sp. TaxID=1917967 RepID=UPI002D804888|nr:NYN domain-containing protein [Ramlibacter sp.]HET8745992.1 NYN domain-containing protein [Ramlibacter sp.]